MLGFQLTRFSPTIRSGSKIGAYIISFLHLQSPFIDRHKRAAAMASSSQERTAFPSAEQHQTLKAQIDELPQGSPDQISLLVQFWEPSRTLFNTTKEAKYLDQYIKYARAATDIASENDKASERVLDDLSEAYFIRGDHVASTTDIYRSTQLMLRLLRREGRGEADRSERYGTLATTFLFKYSLTEHHSDIDSGIEYYIQAIETLPGSYSPDHQYIRTLEKVLWQKFLRTGDLQLWDLADAYCTPTVHLRSGDSKATSLDEAAISELRRQGELESEAIRQSRNAINVWRVLRRFRSFLSAYPSMHPRCLRYVAAIGPAYLQLYGMTESVFILDAAIAQFQAAIALGDQQDPVVAISSLKLSKCYRARYLCTTEISDIQAAIQHLTVAGNTLVRLGYATNSDILYQLSCRHSEVHTLTGQEKDLETAIQLGHAALEAAHGSENETARCISHLGWLYEHRSALTDSLDDINIAIGYFMKEYDMSPTGPNTWSSGKKNLASCIIMRTQMADEAQYLESALHWARKLLPDIPEQHSDSVWLLEMTESFREQLEAKGVEITEGIGALTLNDDTDFAHASPTIVAALGRKRQLEQLSSSLLQEFFGDGDIQHLVEAIAASRELLEMVSPDSIDKTKHQIDLGRFHLVLFTATRDPAALEEAFSNLKKALDLASSISPHQGAIFFLLSETYLYRYRQDGAIADLHHAIRLLQAASEMDTISGFSKVQCRHSLGLAYLQRHVREQSSEDLAKGLRLWEETQAAMSSEDPNFAYMLRDYAMIAYARSCMYGDAALLGDAIVHMHRAIDLTPAGHPDRPHQARGLGTLYMQKFEHSKVIGDLNHGIAQFKMILEQTKRNDHLYATALLELGRCYLLKFQIETQSSDPAGLSDLLREICDCFHRAKDISTCDPVSKFSAYGGIVWVYLGTGNHKAAAQLVPEWASLMPSLFPQSLEIGDKQFFLAQIHDAVPLMAAALLSADEDIHKVLTLLETTRGIIMNSLSDIRAPVSELQKVDQHLAEEYVQCRHVLDNITASQQRAHYLGTMAQSHEADERYHADSKLRTSIDAIRKVPGFERFLLPPTEQEFMAAASSGPIAILSVSGLRSDALIIQATGLSLVRLPHLSLLDIRRFERSLSPSGMSMELLEWLWDAVAEPVLSHLGFEAPPLADETWPHIRWITTGHLSKFPIHAAGYHQQPGCSVLDRVISSYSFSVRSLMAGSGRPHGADKTPKKAESITLVGAGRLKFVPKEISRLAQLWEDFEVRKPGPRGTEVLGSLKDSDVFHFAGHGRTHAENPLESALMLDTDRVTISDILSLNLQRRKPFLAYLSACGTSRIRNDKLKSESLHLVAAMQLSGFRHVVGTLWDVEDEACVEVAVSTYSWMQSHGMDDRSVSEGLHGAIRKLRANWISSNPSGRRKDDIVPTSVAPDACQADSPDESGLSSNSRILELDNFWRSWMHGADFMRGFGGIVPEDGDLPSREVESRGVTADCEEGPFHWVPYVHFGP